MGGRGSSSNFQSSGALQAKAPEITIETYYRKSGRAGSHYGDSVIKAVETSKGEIEFQNAQGEFDNSRPNANTVDVTFKIRHGAVTNFNNGSTKFYGINWDNVTSVSGQTYNIRQEIKEHGFKWDGKNKKWVKK